MADSIDPSSWNREGVSAEILLQTPREASLGPQEKTNSGNTEETPRMRHGGQPAQKPWKPLMDEVGAWPLGLSQSLEHWGLNAR